VGKDEGAAENTELVKLLETWGVTVNKDLVLDLSGNGEILGLSPDVPLVLTYEAHPITQPLTRQPTAFPLARSLDIKSGDKTTVSKLFGTGDDSVAVTSIPANGAVDPKQGKKGPLTPPRRAGSSWWARPYGRRTASSGRAICATATYWVT
jgi:ABC-type uncharacterized transport system involved in gliding motility auxiliary subunit